MLNRNLIRLAILLSVMAIFSWSCSKSDSNGPRKEYIEVYLSKDAEEPVSTLSVPSAGGEYKLYLMWTSNRRGRMRKLLLGSMS